MDGVNVYLQHFCYFIFNKKAYVSLKIVLHFWRSRKQLVYVLEWFLAEVVVQWTHDDLKLLDTYPFKADTPHTRNIPVFILYLSWHNV